MDTGEPVEDPAADVPYLTDGHAARRGFPTNDERRAIGHGSQICLTWRYRTSTTTFDSAITRPVSGFTSTARMRYEPGVIPWGIIDWNRV